MWLYWWNHTSYHFRRPYSSSQIFDEDEKPGNIFTDNSRKFFQRVRTYNGLAIRTFLTNKELFDEQERSNSNGHGPKWPSRLRVGLRDAIATCATCMITWPMARQRMRKWCKTFDGPLNPFEAKVTYKPISSNDEARLHQFGKKMLPGIFMGYVLRVGSAEGETGWANGLSRIETSTSQPPMFLSNGSSTMKSHKKEGCCFHVLTNLSKSSIFLNHHALKSPSAQP